ncbi:zealexin A1 synthase-like [Lolium rigidum]|uniref:zealexin A1 synthase-like n=1 Tax=Lolium rigidum TaxID=89674 RepID=UPI001F5DBA58|nr:zealexin A1 synthase-like [Lolium rigidum]
MEGWINFYFIALPMLLALGFLKLLGRKNRPKKNLPPGPWNLPIIGSLHHVFSALPHRKITELCHRHGPLMFLKLGEIPMVVVSSAEVAELVLKTNDPLFAGRPSSVTLDIAFNGKGIAFAPHGDQWRQMRKVCIMQLLSAKQVKRMEGIRTEEMGNLLRSITASSSAGTTVNVSEKVAALTTDLLTGALFGAKFTWQDEYLHEFRKTMELVSGFCLVDMFPSSRLVRWLSNGERLVRRSCDRMQHIIAGIVQERNAVRAARRSASSTDDEDLLDVLLNLQHEDSLPFPLTTEIIGCVLFDICGAVGTISSILVWAMSELVCHPDVMSKAQQEVRKVLGKDRAVISNCDLAQLHYMRMVVKEVLRLHPPGPLLPRATREDCKIMGYDMLKGTNVYLNVFAVSRDPKYWESPQEFNPERFKNNSLDYNGTHFEFIPFGAGRRQCPGMKFSSSVMDVVLANFLYHYDWMLPDGVTLASIDMSEKFGLTLTRKYDLKLRAIPHVGSKSMPSK